MASHEALADRLVAARQTAHILYAEVQKTKRAIQDSTLESASAAVASIPPRSYLRQFATLRGHRDKIAHVCWSADSLSLLLACQDGFMIVWDAVSGMKRTAIPLDNSWVLACAYLPSGRLVALAGLDNRCTVYRVVETPGYAAHTAMGTDAVELTDRPRLGRKTPRAHAAYVSACEFVSDSEVLTALGDMTIALWDMAKDAKVRDFADHTADVLLLLMPRRRPQTFLSLGADGCVKVWDVRTPGSVGLCLILKADVNCVALLPDGYAFAAGADDGLCKIFDLRSDCELAQYLLATQFEPRTPVLPGLDRSDWLRFNAPGVVSVDVSSSGRNLYACYADYGCIVWDTLKNLVVEVIGVGSGSHTDRISQVAVSPDGQGLATASWDSTIKVWST